MAVVNDIHYELIFTIGTYQHKKARMKVSIERQEKLDVATYGNQTLPDGETRTQLRRIKANGFLSDRLFFCFLQMVK